ncbi:hypothetical protein [Litorisediminicola beolgyonensis]|uniref:Type IV pilus biogenesis n=1 Tax=Litorisediminicola beolgyonensis TaxID=1173614 RepID=A0ABW3ZK59_9RHOB
MKPTYALSLTFSGITLLKRMDEAWAVLGDVSLEAEDFDGEITALRELAGPAPEVAIALPASQIKYLDTPAPERRGDAVHAEAARAALDGATPYSVDELRVDCRRDGAVLKVAAVAQETLDEAEAFARDRGFVPVSFFASPTGPEFKGAPFFGAPAGATGPAPERERRIRLVAPETVPEPSEVEDAPTPTPVIENTDDGAQSEASQTASEPEIEARADAAATTGDAAPSVETDPAPEPPSVPDDTAPAASEETTTKPGNYTNGSAAPAPTPKREAPEDDAAPTFRRRESQGEAHSFAQDSPLPRTIKRAASVPGFAEPAAEAPLAPAASRSVPFSSSRRAAPSAPRRDQPAEPPKRRLTLSALSDAETEIDPADRIQSFTAPPPLDPEPAAPPAAKKPAAARPAPVLGPKVKPGAQERLDRIRALRPGVADESVEGGKLELTIPPDEEKRRMTVFGAREDARVVGGKPKYLGLMLTLALLAFLAGVAAWATVFMDDGLVRLFRGAPETAVAAAPEDDIAPELDTVAIVAPEDAAPASENTEVVAEPNDGPAEPVAEDATLDPAELAARRLSSAEAATVYAATGIWQRAPTAPLEPEASLVEEVYVNSIDPEVGQFDALALPQEPALPGDRIFESPPIPAPAGTVYDLDERGMVRATPEGAINPDRVRVFLGPPPAVPPLREPEPGPEAGVAPEGTQEETGLVIPDALLEAFRPAGRPGDLIEQTERARLSGNTLQELALFRPLIRPETVKALAERNATATAQAVSVSLSPSTRPSGFARIVEAARAAPPPVRVATATAAPRVVPSVPSSASVSRQATTSNVLNLRKVNLIGVYGQPSSRRALVRLANGRFVKVAIGDRIDGGRVAAIGESELRYVKGGRSVVLSMPRG